MPRGRVMAALIGAIVLAGIVAARRADAGPAVRAILVGRAPWAVAVDERTGRAFVTTGNAVSVLDSDSGAVLRVVPVGVAPIVLAVAERAGRVFVVNSRMNAGSPGSVSVLDAASGRLVRTVPVGPVPYAVAVDEQAGRVFVLNANDGGVSVLDAASGRLLGTFHDGPNGGPLVDPDTLAVDTRRGRLFVISNGLSATGNTLSVLDVRSGRLVGAPQAIATGLLAVDERAGRAFLTAGSGVVVLDTRTGRALRTVALGGYTGRMVVDERRDRVFVPDRDNGVAILDARSAAILGTASVCLHPAAMAVDERSGHVFVACLGPTNADGTPRGRGSVSEIDPTHARVLRTISVGMDPLAVAVDGHSGHVFVVDNGGTERLSDPWAWLPRWLRRRLPFLPPPSEHARVVPADVSMID